MSITAWSFTPMRSATISRHLDGVGQHHHQVVPVANGGDAIYFDADPTTSASTFVASGSAGDIGDVFFVSAGTDTLTGGSGGGNSFVVVNGADLERHRHDRRRRRHGNVLDFASATSGDTLTSAAMSPMSKRSTSSVRIRVDRYPANNVKSPGAGHSDLRANDGGDMITGTPATTRSPAAPATIPLMSVLAKTPSPVGAATTS